MEVKVKNRRREDGEREDKRKEIMGEERKLNVEEEGSDGEGKERGKK